MAQRPAPLGSKTLVVTGTAQTDIDDCLAHLAAEAGLDVALRFADTIDAALARLAWVGHSGASREWIAPGLRMITIGSYVVYFRVVTTETRIIRFVHGARDINAIIFDPPT